MAGPYHIAQFTRCWKNNVLEKNVRLWSNGGYWVDILVQMHPQKHNHRVLFKWHRFWVIASIFSAC